MFSKQLQKYVQAKYEQRLALLGTVGEKAEQKLKQCTEEEQLLMKFFYGTMPLRDAGEYEFGVFLGFVRHSLMIRQNLEWCKQIPEDIFLHHVLYYRINSENIEDCRIFFYDQLIDRIRGKSLSEAVLEINYWCAENGSYEASDTRTISPVTLYRSGKGRCGEESTFAVTAFRSVGIPARQVYTPWWAHCDSNHAWVEVYIEGKWHFLGACEPEEILDKGWFTNASSRALLVHARNFSDYSNGSAEQCLGQEDVLYFYNVTPTYARTKDFEIRVTEDDGRPAADAQVFVEILNSSRYNSIAELRTDAGGKTSIRIGFGTVHLWVINDGKVCEALVNTGEEDGIAISLRENEITENTGKWTDMDMEAPADYPMNPAVLTKKQKETNRRKLREAGALRNARIAGYYCEKAAEKYPGEKELLRFAAGNFDEIYRFLDKDKNPDRKAMLHSLTIKDMKDAKAEILERHLEHAAKYRKEWELREKLDVYIKYILCPRIFFGEMTDYREAIENFFGGEKMEEFAAGPLSIWSYIKKTIRYDRQEDYSTIFSTPMGTLKLGFGNPMSQKILFVAVCRTLGIPARINPVNREAEVYLGHGFVQVSGTEEESGKEEVGKVDGKTKADEEKGKVILRSGTDENWNYYQNWSIARLDQGRFVTLNYEGICFDDNMLTLSLVPGIYRIITSNRLPSGNQLASEYKFGLEAGQTEEVVLRLRCGRLEELLVEHQLEDFEVLADGEIKEASSLTENRDNILAFLEEGQEPTEHVLNEMLEQQHILRTLDANIYFILRDETALENATLRKVLQAVPAVRIVYGSFDDIVEPLARRMYTDPEKLPLLIVTREGMTGIYGSSGYNVGSVELMLKLLKTAKCGGCNSGSRDLQVTVQPAGLHSNK